MELIKKFSLYLHPYHRKIILCLVCMAIGGLTIGAYALIVKNFVDDVLLSPDPKALPSLIGIILVISILSGFVSYYQDILFNDVGQRIILDLRRDLFVHTLRLSPSYFAKNPTSMVLSRILNDVGGVQNILRSTLLTSVKEGVSIVALLGVMFYRDWSLTLVSLVLFPLLALLVRLTGRRLQRLSRQNLEHLGWVTARLAQSLTNLKVVQSFRREDFEADRFIRENEGLFKNLMRLVKTTALTGPAMDAIRGLGVVVILVIGSYRIASGSLTVGVFVSFATALGLLVMPLRRMVHLFNLTNEGLGALSRVFELLETSPTIQDLPGARSLTPMKESIRFENVGFAYNREWALSNFNLTIPSGEILALVGPSGAGKSTLMNLLLRFYDPAEGSICLDGQDIRHGTLASLRSQISWVSQENLLFNDTVQANIAYGNLNATEEEIRQAARAARAEEFIENFPLKYQTIIGEHGLALSGGERQRIAIARAFLKQAPILILDEATSSVDGATENLIQEAIRELVKGRTTLLIAHRPSTISLATIVVLMEHGKLLDVGTHQTLLEKNDFYKKVYRSQFLHVAG